MKKFTIHVSDGGAGFTPYSENITVEIEAGETWDTETLQVFAEQVRDAAKVCFGVNKPFANIIKHV
jgi:hypothetical protein